LIGPSVKLRMGHVPLVGVRFAVNGDVNDVVLPPVGVKVPVAVPTACKTPFTV
jgi:hypothetical protein